MANRSDGHKEIRRNLNECFVCKTTCYNTCSRCGEMYCSKQCQVNDWLEHKYYCFEMPELIIKPSPSNAQQSNNGPKLQAHNRQMVPHLPGEQVQSKSSENGRSRSVQPLVFNFAGYPKCNDDVLLTHVRNANVFYLRPCSSEKAYRRNAKDFDDYGRSGMNLTTVPQRGDVVLALYDGVFYRAIVLNVTSESKFEVGLVDIGKILSKSIHEMRQISDELKSRQQYNFIVTLNDMPKKVQKPQFDKLFALLEERVVFQIQFDGNDWKSSKIFKLLEKDTGLPIESLILENESNQIGGIDSKIDKNANLVQDRRTLFVEKLTVKDEPTHSAATVETASIAMKDEESVNPPNASKNVNKSHQLMLFEDLPVEALPEVADLVILDNSFIRLKYVSATDRRNLTKLFDLNDMVQTWGEALDEVYKPEVNELCLVKFEDEWYRAVNVNSKFWLIDWGNMENIDAMNIRRFPEELKLPCYTFNCNFQGAIHKIHDDPDRMGSLKELLNVQTKHPNCRCVKVQGELMEYNVEFPALLNFFD